MLRLGPGRAVGHCVRPLETLRTEIGTQSLSIATIEAVRTALRNHWRQTSSALPRDALTQALDERLKTLKRALQESEELCRWETGRA